MLSAFHLTERQTSYHYRGVHQPSRLFALRNQSLRPSPTPTGFAEIVGSKLQRSTHLRQPGSYHFPLNSTSFKLVLRFDRSVTASQAYCRGRDQECWCPLPHKESILVAAIILRVSEAAIDPVAADRNVSERSFAVCSSMVLASIPSR